ncbi:MAG: hypothetical protein JO019_00710 [Candidatus Kaiserbacteria bacterium]|nr:hypothetical protein [Candidatus Kaiserbacteria bacterium]
MKKGALIFWLTLVAIVVLGVGAAFTISHKTPQNLDAFATCLKDKGAVFYGAFWCPHCQATKRLFGASAEKLPYVECSTPDKKDQTQICKDKGITGYPTWIFADGTRMTGELTLEQLAQKTSCQLP